MNHPDWPAFLNAIITEPDEDTPRLVAADFLEENGDPDRAAFIRVQVALARLEASDLGKSLEADALRKKERVFLGPKSIFPHLWAAVECPELVRMPTDGRTGSPLAHLRVEGMERLTWRRGFVEEVACNAAEWLRNGFKVRQKNPVMVASLTECLAVSLDAWYAGLAALRGLRDVWIWPTTGGETQALASWLRGWLPGTQVELPPF